MRIHFCQISLSVALLFSFVFFEQRLSEIGTLSRIGLLDITDQPEDVAKTGNFRSEQTKSSPNVLYTVFAGRKDRLLLQEPYWRELKRIGAIDEGEHHFLGNIELAIDTSPHIASTMIDEQFISGTTLMCQGILSIFDTLRKSIPPF